MLKGTLMSIINFMKDDDLTIYKKSLLLFCQVNIIILLIGLNAVTLSAYNWEVIKSTHFTLYFQAKDSRLAQFIMEGTERDYKRIVTDIGVEPGITAEVYLAPDREVFGSLQPEGRKAHEWAIGIFYPGLDLILLLSTKVQKNARPDIQKVMAHEITHFIMHNIMKRYGIRLPMWLNEGLAMYEAKEWNWHLRAEMTRISITKSFIPISSLEKGFPEDNRLAQYAYVQSISLIAYIINRFGKDSFREIIKHLVNGVAVEDAFNRSIGLSQAELEIEWQKYIIKRYTWIPVITSGFSIWFFITLLFLLIYLHKKRHSQLKMELWDIEDQLDSFSDYH